MKTLLVGNCSPDRVYLMRDPSGMREVEFEAQVIRAITCAYPSYQCIVFEGSFRYDGASYQPDLALVAQDLTHWFIIEVELVSHSFEGHVLPQVRALALGDWQTDCVGVLARELSIPLSGAETLLKDVPHSVVVVANRRSERWADAFAALRVQLLSVTTYEAGDGSQAAELEGNLEVVAESLGFGTYVATDRSLKFSKGAPLVRCLPAGADMVQLNDPEGTPSMWIVAWASNELWLTKEKGVPDLDDRAVVQVIRTVNGTISMRRPT